MPAAGVLQISVLAAGGQQGAENRLRVLAFGLGIEKTVVHAWEP